MTEREGVAWQKQKGLHDRNRRDYMTKTEGVA
jgi:hypothetical protein